MLAGIDELPLEEQVIIDRLEERLNKSIPQLNRFNWSKFGIKTSRGRVSDLLLNDQDLQELPTIASFTELRRIDLSRNNLQQLPQGIGACTKLTQLYCGENEIEDLPEELYSLSQLRLLELQRNRIHTVGSGLARLGNLEELNLSNNPLTELPEIFTPMNKLKRLYLHDTKLKYIPESLTSLEKLEELDISNNEIESIPDLSEIQELKEIDVSNNGIKIFPVSIAEIDTIEHIDLSHNKLERVPRNKLVKLPNIKQIDLHDNPLSTKEIKKLKSLFRLERGKSVRVRTD